MNIFDLQLLFQDKMKPLMTNTRKVFSTSEMERFFNDAQDTYAQSLADVFEVNEKARRAQEKIIKSSGWGLGGVPPNVVPLSDNSVITSPPGGGDDLLRIVEEQVISGSTRITVKPITHDQYLANIDNPYKQPYEKLVWRVDVDDHIELIPNDSTTLDSYEVRYLIKPTEIKFDPPTTDFSYPDYVMKDIVSLAANLAVQSLTVGRQQRN